MATLDLSSLPEGDVILGHVVALKILAADGTLYFAIRMAGLNDMEAYGLAQDMANSFSADLQGSKRDVD